MRAIAVVAALALAGCGGERAAVGTCESLIKKVAKHPSSVEIPAPTKVERVELGHVIQWEHGGGLRMMNNLGAMLDTTATCLVYDENPETMNTLFIDGEVAYSGAIEEVMRREAGSQRQ